MVLEGLGDLWVCGWRECVFRVCLCLCLCVCVCVYPCSLFAHSSPLLAPLRTRFALAFTPPLTLPLRTPSPLQTNSFVFDKVYGSGATQTELYDEVGRPICAEVVKGYHCAILAYGQTGTGKTYTMEGDRNSAEHRGVIPRAALNLFELLEEEKVEYSVKVSFLQLYNEKCTDLLDDSDAELQIFDDPRRGVIVRDLKAEVVTSAEEVLQLLEEASKRRTVSATCCNAMSSRSHCVASFSVSTRCATADGEDLLKSGVLQLVDLAGSESAGRSGATGQQAREARNINRSLLTLGRVISALAKKGEQQHVPYRQSKLTRLLQNALGGSADTCIVATVSPCKHALDETVSTLRYAFCAKDILNHPEILQKKTTRGYVRELNEEITRLKAMLQESGGVRLPFDEYERLTSGAQVRAAAEAATEAAMATQAEELEALREEKQSIQLAGKEALVQLHTRVREDITRLAAVGIAHVGAEDNELASLLATIEGQAGARRTELRGLEASLAEVQDTYDAQHASTRGALGGLREAMRGLGAGERVAAGSLTLVETLGATLGAHQKHWSGVEETVRGLATAHEARRRLFVAQQQEASKRVEEGHAQFMDQMLVVMDEHEGRADGLAAEHEDVNAQDVESTLASVGELLQSLHMRTRDRARERQAQRRTANVAARAAVALERQQDGSRWSAWSAQLATATERLSPASCESMDSLDVTLSAGTASTAEILQCVDALRTDQAAALEAETRRVSMVATAEVKCAELFESLGSDGGDGGGGAVDSNAAMRARIDEAMVAIGKALDDGCNALTAQIAQRQVAVTESRSALSDQAAVIVESIDGTVDDLTKVRGCGRRGGV